jgi:ankyrin repeat protein
MNFLKVVLVALALSLSFNAAAAKKLTDDESVEFTDAIGKGDMKVIKKYMDAGVDVNVGYFAWPPLLMAAAKGQLQAVKYFAEKGGDLNYEHPMTRWTAFHHAAYDGNMEMVKFLAAKGADINKKMRGDVDIIRVVRDKGDTKMVELLESLGVKNDGCMEEKCL